MANPGPKPGGQLRALNRLRAEALGTLPFELSRSVNRSSWYPWPTLARNRAVSSEP
jgi:hypothetical protein